MLRAEIIWILPSILFCPGSLSLMKVIRKSKKKYTETWWKIWAVTVLNKESSILWKSMPRTINSSSSTNIISAHTTRQAPSSLTTWSECVRFLSAPWLYRAANSTAQTVFSAVTPVHGETRPIPPPTFESSSHKFTRSQKCSSTSTIMTTATPKISWELIMSNCPNGAKAILTSLLPPWEKDWKALMFRIISITGSTWYLDTSRGVKLRLIIWTSFSHWPMKMLLTLIQLRTLKKESHLRLKSHILARILPKSLATILIR